MWLTDGGLIGCGGGEHFKQLHGPAVGGMAGSKYKVKVCDPETLTTNGAL